ncbi:UDP-N-acetylmuramate dehydrogenase [Veronia pacifica]|uniref:UDP-N-acetylenolpyruvoylglucosamine reductase n=1 Tax=Veronia pacifica TaxID=1080227 RepID=A0A1C3E701_9GAMM|nr:UDP-N-acetylmuramate dehydrogenase [Veronia pacifica]ODA29026.1 UDP-N-acetylenolpyruvoylglucosamine reductase [Veronia pacifica]
MKTLSNTSLKPFHTFGLDVSASVLLQAECVEDLAHIWCDDTYANMPKLLLGEGSNVLFCEDFKGVVVLNHLKGVQVTDDSSHWHLHVAAGENWHQLVKWTLDNGMPGLENLALIPGLTGSAPIQNIGAYGVELERFCRYVDILMTDTGEQVRLKADDCQFGYRDSVFKRSLQDKAIILAVGLSLPKSWKPEARYGALAELEKESELSAKAIFERVCAIRSSKLPDPNELGNAGSFFKNPIVTSDIASQLTTRYPEMPCYPASKGFNKLAAGWLIDKAGLKGLTMGGAAVHDKQALVLVNKNCASPQDILNLAAHVVSEVRDQFGVSLEHEVRFIGKHGETTLEAVCQQ